MRVMLKPYPEYKDSGVPWLGKIPKHWERFLLRSFTRPKSVRGRPDLPLLSVYRDYGVILRASREDNYNPEGADLSTYKIVSPGDLVLNKMKTWQGSLGVAEHAGIVSPAYIVCNLVGPLHSRFLHHLLRSRPYIDHYNRLSFGIRVNQWDMRYDDFKQIPVHVPPLDEQRAIAGFIDVYDRHINRLIRTKRRLIELLNEQKQGIIHRAVTRGLDPNVRLRPSGIDWLGDVPIDWQVTCVRRLISFITSGSRGWADFYSDSGDLFIQSGNISRMMTLNLERVQYVIPPSGAEGLRTQIAKDDILVCITGALTGNVALVSTDLSPAYVNQHVALLRPEAESIIPRFLAYSLYSDLGQSQFKLTEYGGTKQGLGLNDVRDIVILLPSREEQHKIIAELDVQTTRIQSVIDSTMKEIDLLREYRTRLIADVVTGKLDVRSVKFEGGREKEEEGTTWFEDETVEDLDEGAEERGDDA